MRALIDIPDYDMFKLLMYDQLGFDPTNMIINLQKK